MKAVMMSIHPKWCELIASGEKTIEVRKTRPKTDTPFIVYIYETKGKTEIPTFVDEEGHEIYEGRGQVIGEFVCDVIFETLDLLQPEVARKTCLSDEELSAYLGKKDGYGWHISELNIYDKPIELSAFRHCGENYYHNYIISKPPQSWCYVEEAMQ